MIPGLAPLCDSILLSETLSRGSPVDNTINEFLLNQLEKLDEKLDEIKEQGSETRAALLAHEVRDEQIHEDVKKMGGQLAEQSHLLDEYNKQLEIHIAMSKNLMKRQDVLDGRLQPLEKERSDRIAVQKHTTKRWKKIAFWLSIIATTIGIVATVAKLG